MDKERGLIVCAVTALAAEYLSRHPKEGSDGFAQWLDGAVVDKMRTHASDVMQALAKIRDDGGDMSMSSQFHVVYQQVMDGYAPARERWNALSELDRRILIELLAEVEKNFDGVSNPFGALFLPAFADQLGEQVSVVEGRLTALAQRGLAALPVNGFLDMPYRGVLFVWEASHADEFEAACNSLAWALPQGEQYAINVASAAQIAGIPVILASALVELWEAQGYLRVRDMWPKGKATIFDVLPALRVAHPRDDGNSVSGDHDALDEAVFGPSGADETIHAKGSASATGRA